MPPPVINPDFERRAYWHATMPSLPDRRGRALPDTADIVVVGGGYTGISCALALARGGASVTLLEAHELGRGASTRNGGIAHPGYKWGLASLVERYGAARGTALFQESLDAYAFLRTMIEESGIECEWREHGHLELAHSHAHVAGLELDEGGFRALDQPARMLSGGDLLREVGSTVYPAALAVDGSGLLHPGKWFAGLAGLAETAGVDLHEGVRARAVRRQADGRVVVETDRGAVLAGQVVVATNGYTDGAAPWLRRRVIPVGSYIIATAPLSEEVARSVAPTGRAFFDTKNFLNYWHVATGRRLLFGGRVSFVPTTVDRTAAILYRQMIRVHPQVTGVRVDYAWGGKVALTMDRMPHVGRSGPLAYAMGYCGSGVAMSVYLGTRLAGWLGGGPAPVLAGLRFPVVPVPFEGRPWFLPIVGEWLRLQDRLAARVRPRGSPGAGPDAAG